MLPKKNRVLLFCGIIIVFITFVVLALFYNFGQIRNKFPLLSFWLRDKFVASDLSYQTISQLSHIPLLKILDIKKPQNSFVEKKLRQANNVLLYQGNANDTTGRTLLVDTDENIHTYTMVMGGAMGVFESKDGEKIIRIGAPWRETGIFKEWAKTFDSYSNDLYMILSDTQNNNFAVRISRGKNDCYSPNNQFFLTDFLVQDLNLTADSGTLNDLGFLSAWTENDLANIIKPGDVIVVYNQQYDIGTKSKYRVFSRFDKNHVICAESVVIHRFGGKKQLEFELFKNIPDINITPTYTHLIRLYKEPKTSLYDDPRLGPLSGFSNKDAMLRLESLPSTGIKSK